MRKLQQTFGLSLKLLAAILFINIVFATNIVLAIPGVPHQFYGEVKINGNPAPDGVEIKVYDLDIGQYVAGTFTKDGKYGYDPIFYVQDPEGNRYGHTLAFYVADVKAIEYTFENGMSTKLDLEVEIPNFCGDGICDSGESCTSCQKDCGSCPSASGEGGGSSGTSGSSGGGYSAESGTGEINNVGSNESSPETNITKECVENWKCTDWFECFNGRQKRVCMDLNECNTTINKPETVRECKVEKGSITGEKEKSKNEENEQILTGRFLTSPLGFAAIFAGFLVVTLLLVYITYTKKSKKSKKRK